MTRSGHPWRGASGGDRRRERRNAQSIGGGAHDERALVLVTPAWLWVGASRRGPPVRPWAARA
ncbi:MAG: hypothetical protein WA484_09180 [Solirubrobacteraceae bacterium]